MAAVTARTTLGILNSSMHTEENELVQLATKYAGDVKPHAKKIVGVAIVVAVGLVAFMFMRQRAQVAAESALNGEAGLRQAKAGDRDHDEVLQIGPPRAAVDAAGRSSPYRTASLRR